VFVRQTPYTVRLLLTQPQNDNPALSSSHSHTHTLSHSHALTLTRSHTHTLTLTLTHTLSHSHSLTVTMRRTNSAPSQTQPVTSIMLPVVQLYTLCSLYPVSFCHSTRQTTISSSRHSPRTLSPYFHAHSITISHTISQFLYLSVDMMHTYLRSVLCCG
jgi:hypothetical protein